jgi:phage/plasmid-like protein (TIGR03299 family)
MAHDINVNEATGKASIFVVKEPAWHGLGQVVENALTAEKAIEAAQLDWEVEKRPVYYNWNSKRAQVPGSNAVVRMDNGDVLGVVGDTYTPIQNREAFSFFDNLVNEGQAIYHSAGALGKGERIWILAKLPTDIVIGNDDLINNYVLIYNSHDGSAAVSALITPIRVVCNNTLTAAIRGAKNKITVRHTKNVVQNLQEAHKLLGLANRYRVELEGAFQQFAKKNVTEAIAKEYLSKVFDSYDNEGQLVERSKRTKSKIMDIFESNVGGQDMATCKGTMFGLYNALTFYHDNVSAYKDENSRAYSTWFGNSASTREWGFKKALEMV